MENFVIPKYSGEGDNERLKQADARLRLELKEKYVKSLQEAVEKAFSEGDMPEEEIVSKVKESLDSINKSRAVN